MEYANCEMHRAATSLHAFPSSSRVRVAQKCVQKCNPLRRCRAHSQFMHSSRRPPHGGLRMECVNRQMRGAAAMEC
eukprot:1948069-Lingulodinium_polyedra.AAC.1